MYLFFLIGFNTVLPAQIYKVETELLDEYANEETQKLYSYLKDLYGKKVLSGQMDLTWHDDTDMIQRVFDATGKYPAMMGYDFMNYYKSDGDEGSGLKQVEEAIEYWNKGGLVSFCWHWRDPSNESIAFYTEQTDFRIDLDDPEVRDQLIADIDLIAADLKELEEAGVPVIWRPLHEASGGWFWWGATGAEPAVELWKLMIDRLNNHHDIHNLIWVWNGQDPAWYPGDEYVDIISEDIYPKVQGDTLPDYSSQKARFMEAQQTPDETKIVALSENGTFPSAEAMIEDEVYWSWFMTWNDGPDPDNPRNFFSGTYFNSHEHKKAVFNHPLVLTLED
ncbi:MAG: glycosyl hydrolase, partial [Gracilimonas sp.]